MLSYIQYGACAGLVGGLISSAYVLGGARRMAIRENPFALYALSLSGALLVGGPFVGASAGAGLYGIKKVVSNPNCVSKNAKIYFAIIIASIVAHNLGYKE